MFMENGIFSPAKISAHSLGMASAYIVSNIMISPAILGDLIYDYYRANQTTKPYLAQTDIRVYDLIHLLEHEEVKSQIIYKNGFFTSSRSLKIASESIGTLVNGLVAATTYLLVSLLEMSLIIALTPVALVLCAAATLAGCIYCLAKSYQVGFQEQCVETINCLSENIL